jgi:hypothetical protein
MASRVWPGQDPIGKRLSTHGAQERDDQWQTVVGVVASARYREIESPRLDVYVPLRQAESFVNHYVVRTAIDPAAVAATLKAETAAFDRALTIGGVKTMEEIVARTNGPWRFNMLVFSLFGLVALGLSATGLFALIAYSVAQRTREIGVRIALGADRVDVIRLMLAEGAALAGIGVACGLIAAALLTRLLAGLLFGISATDPVTFAAVSALLVAVAALASYLPSRRAAAVDPLIALRTEQRRNLCWIHAFGYICINAFGQFPFLLTSLVPTLTTTRYPRELFMTHERRAVAASLAQRHSPRPWRVATCSPGFQVR